MFSRKPLFGYKAFVFATMGIGGLGFSVWAHHMFTTGAVLKPFFGFMTFMIGVPTGVKIFNWLATLWRGSISFEAPMLFALGFVSMFLIGGINGTFSAAVPVDFAIHDTYFVVAHIHYVLFGGSVFAVFAGLYYWFPKIWGRRLNERLGKLHFAIQFIGFNLAFFPMHLLGLDGMPRRIATYYDDDGWETLNMLSTVGAFLIAVSMIPFLIERGHDVHAAEGPAERPVGGQHPRVVDDLAAARSTTSTTSRRSTRSARSSTFATASRPATRPDRPDRRAERTVRWQHTEPTQHKQGLSNGMLGFILFLASEVMFFGGLFAAYFIARADAPAWPPEDLLSARADRCGGANSTSRSCCRCIATILLVISSVTIQLAVFCRSRRATARPDLLDCSSRSSWASSS